jgi:head-tail adaptor
VDVIRLNKVVVFKQNTPTSSTTGGKIDAYATLVTTKGKLSKRSTSKGFSAGEHGFDNSSELRVRFQDAIFNAIRTDLKILIDSVTYTIHSWEKMDEKRFYLKFIVIAQSA